MKDHEIDAALESAASHAHSVRPEVLDRIATSIHASLHPVRPSPRAWMLTAGLFLVCAAVALAGAWHAGFFGLPVLDIPQRVIILSMLAILTWSAARELVAQWTPGSRHYLAPRWLVALASVTLLFTFALLFNDYHATRFLSAGVICLLVGIVHAVPAAVLAAWLLKRGLAVEPISAGTIAGAFGGLSGVTLLELHCPNLEAPHVLVWHVAVVPVSAALGALAGWVTHTRKSMR